MLALRPFVHTDIPALLTWFPDEASLIQWGGPDLAFPLRAADVEQMLAEAAVTPPARLLWSGTRDGDLCAHAQVALDWRHGVGRLARVGVAPACRGAGLAAPFLAAVVDRFFALDGFERLELNVYTFNTAAIRTYLRLGFVAEGVRRSSVRVGAARWDTAIYGLLRHERAAT
jgi:RimJ/RimL family protein N-acetyltransferase